MKNEIEIWEAMIKDIRWLDTFNTESSAIIKYFKRKGITVKRDSVVDEMECPECNSDMKEFVSKFMCRNKSCLFKYDKKF